jgi:hypothetical protein
VEQMPLARDKQLVANDGSSCSSSRFTCVMLNVTCNPNCFFSYEGVLDRETGLVWQRDWNLNGGSNWAPAQDTCLQLLLGNRRGWRAATLAEMATLMDSSVVNPFPSLPDGHPFQNTSFGTYWTSTEVADDPTQAYSISFIGFMSGVPGSINQFTKTGSTVPPLCVRGPETQ